MPVRIVQSKQNPGLKQLRHALAHPGHELKPAAIEGPNLLREAVRAGLRLETVFVAQDAENLLTGLALPDSANVLLVPRPLLIEVLATETPQPIAALVEPPQWTWNDLLGRSAVPLIVVLAGLQDPGNLGTIVRSAEAFGVHGIISLPGTVSAWNPKAVRASAGSLFRVPLLHAQPDEAFHQLKQASVRTFATTVHEAASASAANLARPAAFIIGNEGNGLAVELATQADATLTIPCPGPVESLNVAIAASILLYEASRQRTASNAKGGTQ